MERVEEKMRKVTCLYKLNGIMDLDMAKRTILVDFAVKLRWNALQTEENDWAPELVILNACDEPHVKDKAVTVEENATKYVDPQSRKEKKSKCEDSRFKKLYLRLYADLWQDLDMTCFPFDTQHFVVATRFPRHQKQGIESVAMCEPQAVIFEGGFRNFSGMEIQQTSTRVELQGNPGDPNTKPTAFLTVVARRESFYYTSNIGLPLCVMVAVAFDAFLLSPEQHVERIALIVTVMLTVVTFKITLGERMPVLVYTTVMDRWIVFLFLLLFCMAAESIFVFLLIQSPDAKSAADMACGPLHDQNITSAGEGNGTDPPPEISDAMLHARQIDKISAVTLGFLFVAHTSVSILRPALMAGTLHSENSSPRP